MTPPWRASLPATINKQYLGVIPVHIRYLWSQMPLIDGKYPRVIIGLHLGHSTASTCTTTHPLFRRSATHRQHPTTTLRPCDHFPDSSTETMAYLPRISCTPFVQLQLCACAVHRRYCLLSWSDSCPTHQSNANTPSPTPFFSCLELTQKKTNTKIHAPATMQCTSQDNIYSLVLRRRSTQNWSIKSGPTAATNSAILDLRLPYSATLSVSHTIRSEARK